MHGDEETGRSLGDVVRYGTIASVDLSAARVTVQAGELVSGPVPWIAGRASAGLSHWSPPNVGEQCILLCPEGEIAAGVALLGVYSNANAAPASDDAHSLHFGDGAVIRYDANAHALAVTLPDGATATISAPGGLTITGDVTVNGQIIASGDVTGQGTSLHTHKHGQVKAGTDQSGMPL